MAEKHVNQTGRGRNMKEFYSVGGESIGSRMELVFGLLKCMYYLFK